MSRTSVETSQRMWSVTTLIKLGLGTSEAIVRWNIGVVAEKAIDDEHIWKSRLENEGRESAVKYLKERSWVESDHAKARGTLVHAAAEAHALGETAAIDYEVLPYVEQFKQWVDEHHPRYVMAEAPVYNLGMRYAGTLDGIMELGGKRLLYDIKTTQHSPMSGKMRPPFPEVALQLCAYSRAQEVGILSEQRYSSGRRYYVYDPTKPHEVMPEVDGAVCIVVSPYDCFAVPVRIDDDVWRSFQAVVKCARWTLRGDTDLFGPPIPAIEAVA
jgi:hypothetical protein